MAPKANIKSFKKQKPSDFCEHEIDPCVFCGRSVRYGHYGPSDMVILHDEPTCQWFAFCDDTRQFAMFTLLKLKSDAGQLERN